MRDTGGALGYALGEDPDLANMTASITRLSEGDVVFLVSDGVSDNFDPVTLGMARHTLWSMTSQVRARCAVLRVLPCAVLWAVLWAALRVLCRPCAALRCSEGLARAGVCMCRLHQELGPALPHPPNQNLRALAG